MDMKLYSVMPLDVAHLDEICADVKRQIDEGICVCPIFMVRLVPEGDPVIDKASIEAGKYILFRDRLREMGLPCGILVQCTIGHGYVLDKPFPFRPYVNLSDGEKQYVCCPYDEGVRAYLREQFEILAALSPDVIMVDDDFRLMTRDGRGCGCPMHLAAVEKKIGKPITREALYATLMDGKHPCHDAYTDAFVDTQKEALLGAARAMREGIDAVDPTIQGVACTTGHTAEFGAEIGKILAGEGNPVTVRLSNGNYTPAGARGLSLPAFRAALQGGYLRDRGVDVLLAETDTCPQNRYSTGAGSLHSHFTASILEGATGAKHWITRLSAYEPASGEAYRKKLGKNSGFYRALCELVPKIEWQGCRIPLPKEINYSLDVRSPKNGFLFCVLERMGLPVYFSREAGGATFLDGAVADYYDDETVRETCEGTFFLASDTAAELCERGFSEYLGVKVEEWQGERISLERVHSVNDNHCAVQVGIKRLTPIFEDVIADATVYHLKDGVEEIPLFPAVTVYDNKFGGRAVVFAGTPRTAFNYWEAFSFLNETRKAQLVGLLRASGNLPVCYVGDEEVYLKAGRCPDGSLMVAIFNIGLDPAEEIVLNVEGEVGDVEYLSGEGKREKVAFRREKGNVVIERAMNTLDPVILFLKETKQTKEEKQHENHDL
ncbi:MAG: hypothetical protein IKJ35_06585 [Clostridia bacterium]|nr:hypothetical protein [Clostridia bacterium]